jgi:transcriptional regulator of arginine metabolism
MTRIRRHAILRDLLARTPYSTQDALVEGLARSGIEVTQATVSRDLAAIGAVRSAEGYHLADLAIEPASTSIDEQARLRAVLRDHVLHTQTAGSLVVLRTAPGHADFVATELDAARPKGMVGCIAGDDTIFIATKSNTGAGSLARSITTALEG